MQKHAPAFIGIGVPHAGLGTVVSWLEAHPEIVDSVAPMNFFNTELYSKRGTDWYEERLFDRHEKLELLRGDCTPGYLASEHAAERIVRDYPTTKLFVILRHPIYRALAEYKAAQSIDTKASTMSAAAYLEAVPSVLRHSHYAKQLERYFAYYSPLQLNILFYEDILATPLDQIQSLYGYLEVAKDFVPDALKPFAPPPEEPKNPGLIKRNTFRLKMKIRALRMKPAAPVFPPDTALRSLLTVEEWDWLVAHVLPEVDHLSHMLSRDMSYYWGLRADE